MPAERWNEERAKRVLRADVPFDDLDSNREKAERIRSGFATLREKLAEVSPDVLIVFGNDQRELFDFSNYPAIAVMAGERFTGSFLAGTDYNGMQRGELNGSPHFAATIVSGLMRRGFDPAFSIEMPAGGHGMPHAIMNATRSLTDLSIPIVPILLNCYYTPQITAERSYQLGIAIRQIIEADTSNLRVAVIGSGGLWHTPGEEQTYIDEEFDSKLLTHMAAGNIRQMARSFDEYEPPASDGTQVVASRGAKSEAMRAAGFESTGLPTLGGPQGGTRETCCWIAAAAVADGFEATVIDYVPINASPIGVAFAYWSLS